MYYFINKKAGEVIDYYLTGKDVGHELAEYSLEWQVLEGNLHSAIEKMVRSFDGPASSARMRMPKIIGEALTDDWNSDWHGDLAKAFYLEAVDLYKGDDLPRFKASLKIALFDLIAGLNSKKEKV